MRISLAVLLAFAPFCSAFAESAPAITIEQINALTLTAPKWQACANDDPTKAQVVCFSSGAQTGSVTEPTLSASYSPSETQQVYIHQAR